MTEIEPAVPIFPAAVMPPRRGGRSPYQVYLRRFSGESQRIMRGCLDRIAAILTDSPDTQGLGEQIPWELIRYPHAVGLRARFLENGKWKSPVYVNLHLSALRGILKECWRLDLMSAEDYQRARDVENVKGRREPAGRNIRAGEISRLLGACLDDGSPRGIRDAALIAVLQSTGLRRAEAAAALIERYDHGERSLKIIGKGNKERTVYLHPGAASYLERWLARVGERRGPVFRGIDRWGNVSDGPLSPRAVGWIVKERHAEAGIDAGLSTHDFRRTFIGDFIDAGGDLVQAQKLAGHASATTTAGYDRRPGRALRAAVDRMPGLPSPDALKGTGPDAA